MSAAAQPSSATDSARDAGLGGGQDAGAEDRELRWQCRRGMLELDLLLTGFVDQGYAELGEDQRTRFRRLLEHPDQRLHDWLVGGMEPPDSDLRALVGRIRALAISNPA